MTAEPVPRFMAAPCSIAPGDRYLGKVVYHNRSSISTQGMHVTLTLIDDPFSWISNREIGGSNVTFVSFHGADCLDPVPVEPRVMSRNVPLLRVGAR